MNFQSTDEWEDWLSQELTARIHPALGPASILTLFFWSGAPESFSLSLEGSTWQSYPTSLSGFLATTTKSIWKPYKIVIAQSKTSSSNRKLKELSRKKSTEIPM